MFSYHLIIDRRAVPSGSSVLGLVADHGDHSRLPHFTCTSYLYLSLVSTVVVSLQKASLLSLHSYCFGLGRAGAGWC